MGIATSRIQSEPLQRLAPSVVEVVPSPVPPMSVAAGEILNRLPVESFISQYISSCQISQTTRGLKEHEYGIDLNSRWQTVPMEQRSALCREFETHVGHTVQQIIHDMVRLNPTERPSTATATTTSTPRQIKPTDGAGGSKARGTSYLHEGVFYFLWDLQAPMACTTHWSGLEPRGTRRLQFCDLECFVRTPPCTHASYL
eukprot:PhF_6_TR17030/c0_g1_i1/m.25860